MGRHVRAEIAMADREMGRFIRAQYAEARRLGYPRMSTFARDIARGDVGMPPPTAEDPIMDAVGAFYWTLLEIERRVLAGKYLKTGTEKERARMVGVSVHGLRKRANEILFACSGWLRGRGF